MSAADIPADALERWHSLGLEAVFFTIVPELPMRLKAAVCTIESRVDPTVYNHYTSAGLRIGHWTGINGTDDPPRDTYANSILQILSKYPRGLSRRDLYDVEKSARVIFKELLTFYHWLWNAGFRGAALDAGVYAAHNRGAGNLKAGVASAKAKTIEALVAAFPYMPESAKPRSIAVYKHAAALAAAWDAHILSEDPPAHEDAPQGEPLPDDALCSMEPDGDYCTAPMCLPPDLLMCMPDEGPMSYAAAPEE